jgi:iron complex outermembrane receptor protein
MRSQYKFALCATTVLGLGVLSLGLATPAMAQAASPAASPPADTVSAIVVTARRQNERLQDVPISITIYNQQQLSDRNVVNAADLANVTPSMAADTRFGTDNASFAIRGFTQELRTTQTVATYFADVVTPRTGSSLIDGAGPGAFFDLQNVQVLKGPQGTLFGRNTTGGAVLLVPQKPTDSFGGYLEGSAGNFNLERFQGALNVPISSTLRARFAFDQETRDGTLRIPASSGIQSPDMNDVNYFSLRGSLVWDVLPNLENYTIATYTQLNDHPGGAQLFACDDSPPIQIPAGQCDAQLARQTGYYDFPQNSTVNPHNRSEQAQVINTTTWRASDQFTVKNIFSYAHTESHLATPVFGTNFTDPLGLPFYFTNSGARPGQPAAAENTLVEELQFQGNAWDRKLTWQGGLYYEHSTPDGLSGLRSAFDTACDLSTLGGAPSQFRCTDNNKLFGAFRAGGIEDAQYSIGYENKAAYFQATYNVTKQLALTAGVRYTWDDTSSFEHSLIYGFPAGPTYAPPTPGGSIFVGGTRCESPVDTPYNPADSTTCSSHQTQHSEAPTWSLDADYKLTPDNMVYAKYARGYRQGSVIPLGLGGFNSFGPEEVNSYEIGSKNTFRTPLPVTLNMAVFYNDFVKQQLQLGLFPLSGVSTTAIYSGNSSTLWGIELEGNVELFEGFRVSAGYTYLHTEVNKLNFPSTSGCATGTEIGCFIFGASPNAAVGQPLPNSPEHKATITASYRLPTADALGAITIAATYNVTSKFQTCAISAGSPFCGLPGYGTVNLNLDWNGIAGSDFDGSVFVTNLLDHHYATFVNGTFQTGFESRALGDPMMAGVRLKYHFGGR